MCCSHAWGNRLAATLLIADASHAETPFDLPIDDDLDAVNVLHPLYREEGRARPL